MDSIALAAVVGLAFLGKRMSDAPSQNQESVSEPMRAIKKSDIPRFEESDTRFRTIFPQGKKEVKSFYEVSPVGGKAVNGNPVYQMPNRENVSNQMRNLNPNPWMRIGPGIGVGPDVPAYGGYQQLARELPTNVNEYKLTQLPGRMQAPPGSLIPMQENRTMVSKNRPERDFHREPAKATGAFKGPEDRPVSVRKNFTTTKDQAINNGPGNSSFMGAKYNIGQAYLMTGNQSMDKRDARSKEDRTGNPGRMNVRAGPLGAGGAISTVRIDTNSTPVVPGGTRVSQGYARTGIQDMNPHLGNGNPLATDKGLQLARKQLDENIYNHPLS